MSNPLAAKQGHVYFVGAGPGAPGLITVRGAELIAAAEVVLYDYLTNPLILLHACEEAEQICLGRHGKGRILPQEEINRLIVARAREGKIVVRLKCGDPVVFGRMGSELQALVDAGVAFEIVPGVTAALAAPSFAGVPVTHRDHASAVALVTGQEQSDATDSKLDFEALANFPGTLVFYMGVTTAREWSAKLIRAGRDPDTPAVIVRRCSWTDQEVISCTLRDVASEIEQRQLRPPVVVLVGDACRQETTFAWSQQQPLSGQTVMVTRPRQQAAEMCRRLTHLGAGCIVQSAIAIAPPDDWSPVDRALEALSSFDWLVFSSANGVRAFLDRLYEKLGDLRALGQTKIAVIGPRTAETLASYRLKPDIQPESFRAEALAEVLTPAASGCRFLLCRASRGREVLAEQLSAAGGDVQQIVVYQSLDVTQPGDVALTALNDGKIDWITVTSSAIARSLVAMFGESLNRARLVSISPITTATLEELGYAPQAEAGQYTTDGVIKAILDATRT